MTNVVSPNLWTLQDLLTTVDAISSFVHAIASSEDPHFSSPQRKQALKLVNTLAVGVSGIILS